MKEKAVTTVIGTYIFILIYILLLGLQLYVQNSGINEFKTLWEKMNEKITILGSFKNKYYPNKINGNDHQLGKVLYKDNEALIFNSKSLEKGYKMELIFEFDDIFLNTFYYEAFLEISFWYNKPVNQKIYLINNNYTILIKDYNFSIKNNILDDIIYLNFNTLNNNTKIFIKIISFSEDKFIFYLDKICLNILSNKNHFIIYILNESNLTINILKIKIFNGEKSEEVIFNQKIEPLHIIKINLKSEINAEWIEINTERGNIFYSKII